MRAKPYRQDRSDSIVDAAVMEQTADAGSLLPLLQDVQRTRGFLSVDAMGAVSDKLKVSDAKTYGAASFYSMLDIGEAAKNVIRVCDGPVCSLHGCDRIRAAVESAIRSPDCRVERTSCLGLCDRAPAALVNLEPCGPIHEETAAGLLNAAAIASPSWAGTRDGEVRIVMDRIGRMASATIGSAIDAGAWQSLVRALKGNPGHVLRAVTESGLQGRGGAGFSTGRKWQLVADQAALPKYIICNADESEPMAFKDRVLMEGDPHLLLEGMALAGYAIGSHLGYIYIRGEYETAARRLEQAILEASEHGWLGDNIQSSGFSFHIHVHRGAGAYICGEETALLESLEGRRGEPRIRPPYPSTEGFLGRPTVVNNVETLCNIPAISVRGAEWYRSIGTTQSPGTKVFTVTGHVQQPGAFETPFGITLRQIIDHFCGGMQAGSQFKAALTGGAAGTIVGEESLDIPLDFTSFRQGVSLGSGAILIVDHSVRIADLLGWVLHFFEAESCGKCTPCREGTREARIIIDRLRSGDADPGDLDQLKRLSKMLRMTSFCGLGQSVAWPIDSALKNFGDELAAQAG